MIYQEPRPLDVRHDRDTRPICPTPDCGTRVVYRGQFCARCVAVQRETVALLRAKHEAARTGARP